MVKVSGMKSSAVAIFCVFLVRFTLTIVLRMAPVLQKSAGGPKGSS